MYVLCTSNTHFPVNMVRFTVKMMMQSVHTCSQSDAWAFHAHAMHHIHTDSAFTVIRIMVVGLTQSRNKTVTCVNSKIKFIPLLTVKLRDQHCRERKKRTTSKVHYRYQLYIKQLKCKSRSETRLPYCIIGNTGKFGKESETIVSK